MRHKERPRSRITWIEEVESRSRAFVEQSHLQVGPRRCRQTANNTLQTDDCRHTLASKVIGSLIERFRHHLEIVTIGIEKEVVDLHALRRALDEHVFVRGNTTIEAGARNPDL